VKLAISPVAPSQRGWPTLLPTSLPLTPGPRLRLHPAGVEEPVSRTGRPAQVATIPTLFP
jgi:hypothetical protein